MPAGYDSPIGKKQFAGQPMKEVVIPDESGYAPPARPTKSTAPTNSI